MSGSAPADWWEGYFDRRFLELYRPLLPADSTREEVAGVVELLGLPRGARVLDLACGWGRHAVELARHGGVVTGLDRSATLLEEARRLASERDVRVEWVRGDMRELPFRDHFHAVLSLFSSLGYFGSDGEDLRVLREIARVLRPRGRLVLETMHRDQVAREFAERDWWEGPHGEHVWVERSFDAVAGVSREWLRWSGKAGAGEKYHEIRIRSATEWERLLGEAGLEPLEWLGGWDLSPFSHESERLIVLARRA